MRKLTGPNKLAMEAAGVKFGCHVDSPNEPPDDHCVLDYGHPPDCDHAHRCTGWVRKTRESCRFWQPVKDEVDHAG